MKRLLAAVALAAALTTGLSPAYATHDAAGTAALSEGEIRKVDKDAKKLTIRHAPLENLGMPAMTMVFQVSDAKMLNEVKAGDKVKFAADRIDGAYTVIHLDPAR